METKNLKSSRKEKLDKSDEKMRKILSGYINAVVRGLVSFGIVIVIIFILNFFFDFPNWYYIPIAFLISIMLSFFIGKINVAHYFVDRYIAFLNNIVFKLNNRRINTT
jgi:ABC-type polysaccharide/polyol phosphate export permease